MKEEWKAVEGYEGLYEVSNLGRIKRVDSYVNTGIKHNEKRLVRGKILKLHIKKHNFVTVDLSKEQKVKTYSIHRLVAKAFCPNDDPLNKIEVDHINCDRLDNRASNLEWVTPRENKDRAKANNRYYSTRKKQIYCPQLDRTFNSSYEAAEYLNIHIFKGTKIVSSVAAKIRSCCGGFQKIAYSRNRYYV